MNDIRFQETVLPGGALLLSESVPHARSLALGVWLPVGSRDERGPEDGLAHFLEHITFKGTTRRDAFQIAHSLETVGGSLDAFTGRELTCYYARVLSDSLPLAVDVLCDLVGHPLFHPEHVEKEKSVVLEEIRGLEDTPEDLIHDLVAARVWRGHPLAGSILGREESVQAFTPDRVRAFYQRLYRRPGAVISVAGGFDATEVERLFAEKFDLPAAAIASERTRPAAAAPALINYRRDSSQEYLCLAAETPPFGDERRYALQILTTVLGGGMSSRLFQSIREDAGLAYNVYTYSDFCHDTGLLCSFLGVSTDNARAALERTLAEMERLRRDGFTITELDSARAQIRGGVLMGLESFSTRMNRLARSRFYLGRYQTVDELLACFDRLSVADVMEQAAEFLDPDRQTLVAWGPAESQALNVRPWGEVEER